MALTRGASYQSGGDNMWLDQTHFEDRISKILTFGCEL